MINLNYFEQQELKNYPFVEIPEGVPKDIIVDLVFSCDAVEIYLTSITITDELISCTFESDNNCYYVYSERNQRLNYIYDIEENVAGIIAFSDKLEEITLKDLHIQVQPVCIIQPIGIPYLRVEGNKVYGNVEIEDESGNLQITRKTHSELGIDGLVIELNPQFAKQINQNLLPQSFPFATGCKVKPLTSINGLSIENIQIEGKGLISVTQNGNVITICCSKSLDDICPKKVIKEIDTEGNIDVYIPEECEPCE